jgi:hypothetical protein
MYFSHLWKGELAIFLIVYENLRPDPIFLPDAARGRFGAISSDHCEFS